MICIYAIINVLDDKHYVGQASDKDFRWREHRKSLRGFYHHSILLQRAWCKHGEANFIFVVLEVLSDTSQLNEREVYWGNLLKPEYNMAPLGGSMRGYKHTEEARANMSKAHVGKTFSDETKLKMSLSRIGNKINNGRKQSQAVIDHRASFHKGKITSEATKAKLSEAQKGRVLTAEHKLKLSIAARNRVKRQKSSLTEFKI